MLNEKAAQNLWHRAYAHLSINEPDVLEWARGTGPHTFKNLRSKGFLREYCFVVYASGFKFKTIKAKVDDLQDAFRGFEIKKLARMKSIKKVLKVFGNERKAQNFLDGAKLVAAEGFSAFKKRMKDGGVDVLMELPGIGPITKDHLAKNIGLSDVAKADVWLERCSARCGAENVSELIEYLHQATGESRHVIDVALWTFGRDGLLKQDAA